jgi:hypothetical protein
MLSTCRGEGGGGWGVWVGVGGGGKSCQMPAPPLGAVARVPDSSTISMTGVYQGWSVRRVGRPQGRPAARPFSSPPNWRGWLWGGGGHSPRGERQGTTHQHLVEADRPEAALDDVRQRHARGDCGARARCGAAEGPGGRGSERGGRRGQGGRGRGGSLPGGATALRRDPGVSTRTILGPNILACGIGRRAYRGGRGVSQGAGNDGAGGADGRPARRAGGARPGATHRSRARRRWRARRPTSWPV